MQEVKVKDNLSGEILFICNLDEREKAFKYASDCEEMGLDVSVLAPSLPETLIDSLGASQSAKEALQKEIDEEINSHNSCCIEN